MPEKQMTDAQREHIRKEASSTAQVLKNASEDEIDLLLAAELMPSAALVIGLKMVAADRGWNQEQFWRAMLYSVLRQRRAIRESENL